MRVLIRETIRSLLTRSIPGLSLIHISTNPLDSALGRRFFRYEVRPDAALLSAHLGVSAGDRRFTPGAVASDPVAIKRLAFLFWSFPVSYTPLYWPA